MNRNRKASFLFFAIAIIFGLWLIASNCGGKKKVKKEQDRHYINPADFDSTEAL